MAVGNQHREIIVRFKNRVLQWVLDLMGLEVLIKDISQKITNVEYQELLALYSIEKEKRDIDNAR
jgi:hypothetical protein